MRVEGHSIRTKKVRVRVYISFLVVSIQTAASLIKSCTIVIFQDFNLIAVNPNYMY